MQRRSNSSLRSHRRALLSRAQAAQVQFPRTILPKTRNKHRRQRTSTMFEEILIPDPV